MHLGPNHYVIAKREIANLIARPVQGELHWLTPQEWFVHSLPQEWSVHSRHRNDLSKTFNTCMAPSGNPLIYVRGINTQSKIRSRYGEDTKIRWARYGEQDKVSKIRWRYQDTVKIRSRYGGINTQSKIQHKNCTQYRVPTLLMATPINWLNLLIIFNWSY
jgi:hypothetical protein